MIIALPMHLLSLALNLISCSTEVSVGSHLTPMWRPNIIRLPLNESPHGMAAILCHLSNVSRQPSLNIQMIYTMETCIEFCGVTFRFYPLDDIYPPSSWIFDWRLAIPFFQCPWWRHQMETFSALLALCAANTQMPVMRSFDVFFDLRPNKRVSKQSWGWKFETPSRSLWRHCNAVK